MNQPPTILAAVACPTCRARIGEPCVDSNGIPFLDAVHEGRKLAARPLEAPSMAAQDCAWCGKTRSDVRPVRAFDVEWLLCGGCITNEVVDFAMKQEGKRRRQNEERRAKQGAMVPGFSPYPGQDYSQESRARAEVERIRQEREIALAEEERIRTERGEPTYRELKESEKRASCPMCNAPAGKPCITLGKKFVRSSPHPERDKTLREMQRLERMENKSGRGWGLKSNLYEVGGWVQPGDSLRQPDPSERGDGVECPVCGMAPGARCVEQERKTAPRYIRNSAHPERVELMILRAKQGGRARTKPIPNAPSPFNITEVQSPWMLLPKAGQEQVERIDMGRSFTEIVEAAQRQERERRLREQDEARAKDEDRRRVQARTLLELQNQQQARMDAEQEITKGAQITLRPIVGTWNPRMVDGYIIEGMDWPWFMPKELGDVRMYYTLNERKLWIATIALDVTAPGGLSREFWKRGRGSFVCEVTEKALYRPVEVGADLRSGNQKLRWFGHVQAITISEGKCGTVEFIGAESAIEAIANAERAQNPELRLKPPERKFNL